MVKALAALAQDSLVYTEQPDEGVLYAKKISNEDSRIDWAQPAQAVHNHIRGLSPFPGAFFEADFGRGPERIKVLRSRVCAGAGAPGALLGEELTVACGEGALELVEIQRAGKAPMKPLEFLRGVRAKPERLG
jgi:methionyl-tRNA formyltransferase